MIPVRIHMCPICERACDCKRGSKILDENKRLELTDLKPDQCACQHKDKK